MDYLTSTIQDYQPILVGAGCLALGYMYGRHCRALMANQGDDAPMTSDAACCAQITQSFIYISEHSAVDSKTMAVKRPSESDVDYSERELAEKPEKCAKRDLAQLDVFDPHFFHKISRKKEDMNWAQTAFKKQKSAPLSVRREVVRTKAEPDQDSGDETLAQRLEYFTKSASGTRQSTNKQRERDLLKLSYKKKPTEDHLTTSCEVKSAQDHITRNSQKLVSKGAARSVSGLGALATPLDDDDDDDDQGESSLEDTCRSPKTLCLECRAGDEQDTVLERGCQVELRNSALQTETVILPCAKRSTKLITINNTVISDPFEEDLGNDMTVGLMDSADDHTVLLPNEADINSPGARMEVDAHTDAPDAAMLQSRQGSMLVGLPTSPSPGLLHVQDRCVGDEEVPLHKVLKAEICSLPDATDCGERRNPRWCLGKTKSISFRWLGKLSALGSSWRKRKLWRRRSKAKKVAVPAAEPETLSSCAEEIQQSDATGTRKVGTA